MVHLEGERGVRAHAKSSSQPSPDRAPSDAAPGGPVPPPRADAVRVRTLFISDVHLGVRDCQAAPLVDFLRRHDAETFFLIGDIIDGWRAKPGRPWPPRHVDVVSELLSKVRSGRRVVYIPGNHDEFLREFIGSKVGGVEIADRAIHEGADGRRYLVTHGDECDPWTQHAKWLALLGSRAREILGVATRGINAVRRSVGLRPWPLSAWMMDGVKKVMSRGRHFEEHVSAEAKRYQAQGIICGHVHRAADDYVLGVRYLNAGDWMESCTGVVEHHDGRFEIVQWDSSPRAAGRGHRVEHVRVCDEPGLGVLTETAEDASHTA